MKTRAIDRLEAMRRLPSVPVLVEAHESGNGLYRFVIGDLHITAESLADAIAVYAIENGWDDLYIEQEIEEIA